MNTEPEQMFAKRTYAIGLISILIFIAGCSSVPVANYQALQKSSATVLTNTTETFTRIEKMQQHYEVVVSPNSQITPDSFDPPVIPGLPTDIIPELRFREMALTTLVKYIDVLAAFSEKDYATAVDKASVELAGSLKNLGTASKVLSAADAKNVGGIFATVVDVIGQEVVREKRVAALKSVMHNSQNDIKALADLMAHDNEKIAALVDNMLARIVAHANQDRPPFGTAARIDFDERISLQICEAKAIKESLKSISAAILQIPKAHQEIQDILGKKPSDFDALKSLVQEAQRANSFYRDLK